MHDPHAPLAVDLWMAAVSSGPPSELEWCCHGWLTDQERQRADRFRRQTSWNQHVTGRGMCRRLLVRGTNVAPRQVIFETTLHGKPLVVAPAEVQRAFNVSHTDGAALYVDHPASRIGVDVEQLDRNTDIALAERYFAAPEVEYVMGQAGPDARRRAFLRVWTLKESFIKAIGTGLSMPLAEFAFERIDDPQPRVRMLNPVLGDSARWRFAALQPAPGLIAAVALEVSSAEAPPLAIRAQRFESWLSAQA